MVKLSRHILLVSLLVAATLPAAASANLLQSTHFRLDPNAGSSFGGTNSSASYKLQSSGGEASVGAGSSQSYKLTQGYISHLQNSLQLTVVPSGIFSYYPLDTGTGSAIYDISTNANQGITAGGSSWVSGQVGKALSLNGTSQYISTSVSQTDPNPMTIQLWFKTSSVTGGVLAGFSDVKTGAGTSSDRNLYMTNTGQLVFGVHTGTFKTISTSKSYNDNAWHHVSASLGPNGIITYIDGSRMATDGSTTTGASFSGYWRFGYGNLSGWPSAPSSSYFAGSIDELRIYTKQLTDPQINADYLSGLNQTRFAHVIPTVSSGTSSKYDVDAFIQTDAPGYNLNLQATSMLTHTNAVTTIPMIASSLASPALWNEGTTKGLGFTVTGGTNLEAKWGTSPNYSYAAVPLVDSVYHSRDGLSGGIPEKTSLQYRVDTAPAQLAGSYSTTIIYTATLKP